MSDCYGLNYSIKSFAVANEFVVNTNKVCYALGQKLQPFCIYANETQKKYGVLDFAEFDGVMNPDKNLVQDLADFRSELYKASGITIGASDDLSMRLLFFDYLMSISICYVEIPKYVTRDGMNTATFDKFLCTRNPSIMAAWMGLTPSEMQAKYSARIQLSQMDMQYHELRCVKLNHTGKGNSITVPRGAYNVEKMTCIPMYMIYAFVEGFKPLLQSSILEFSFLKDNGTVRVLPTTLSEDILRQYYSDNIYIHTMLSGVDINSVEQGGMTLSSKMNRGYIKVPEVGASIYDGTGVRSLNLARLLSVHQVDSVDKSFINVDLNSVVTNFEDALDYLMKKDSTQFVSLYKAVTGQDYQGVAEPVSISAELKKYAHDRSIFLSTTFHRSLHMFMVSNPQWFPLYTGLPNKVTSGSGSVGVAIEEMDF